MRKSISIGFFAAWMALCVISRGKWKALGCGLPGSEIGFGLLVVLRAIGIDDILYETSLFPLTHQIGGFFHLIWRCPLVTDFQQVVYRKGIIQLLQQIRWALVHFGACNVTECLCCHLAKHPHLHPHIVLKSPAHKVCDALIPLTIIHHVEQTGLTESRLHTTEPQSLVSIAFHHTMTIYHEEDQFFCQIPCLFAINDFSMGLLQTFYVRLELGKVFLIIVTKLKFPTLRKSQ